LDGSEAWLAREEFLSAGDSLSMFLAYAAGSVPYYRSYFGSANGGGYTLDEFPLVSRDELSSRMHEFLASPAQGDSRLFAKTSGSTGKPLTIVFDPASWYELNYETYAEVARTVPALLSYLTPGSPGVILVTAEVHRHPASLVLPPLNCSLFERRILGASRHRDLHLVRELRRMRVPILYGKPTYLQRLALLDSAISPKACPIKPLVVLTSGENLFPDVRETLENWFRCRVYDAYISVEGGLVALQCPKTNAYHVRTNKVRLEVLTPEGRIQDEGTGELVLTNLANWALPLVRYRTGDQGTLQRHCDCGHAGQTLTELPAREAGCFVARGDAVATRSLDAVLRSPEIRQFQVTQMTSTEFALTWIPSSDAVDVNQVNELLRKRLDSALGKVTLRVRAVESITKPGGKVRRYIVLGDGPGAVESSATHAPSPRVFNDGGKRSIQYAVATGPRVIAAAGRDLLTADAAAVEQGLSRLETCRAKLTCGALSTDASKFAAGDRDGGIHIWDLQEGQAARRIQAHGASVSSLVFAGNDKRLISGGFDGLVNIWDASALSRLTATRRKGKPIGCLAASYDGMFLAAVDLDGRIKLRDGLSLGYLRCFGGTPRTLALAFTPDGDALACGCADDTVRLWDACSGRQLGVLKGHTKPVVALYFCPDAKTLVSGSLDGTLRVWHAWSGRQVTTLTGHSGAVRSVFVTRDNRSIVSGGQDGTVRLWPIVPATDL
jgi:phenylacetate-coenzyme A ligase PaaK-like adenylate-forming protein